MYTITHNGNPFYSPGVGGPHLADPVLSMDANRLASMTFTVYPDNPEFDNIDMHTSVFSVYLDDTLLIKLRPAQKKRTFNGGMEYTCEELAARLDDVLHRPDYFSGTVTQYLTRMITAYNALVASANAITLGNVSFIPSTSDTFINDDYEGFWEGIQSNLVGYHGGYVVPRYTDSAIYIDYVTDSDLTPCPQEIAFGKNMADMFIETDSADVFNVLIPLGATVEVSNPQPGQARRRPLNITSVNDGKDYLVNAAGVELYGRREMTHTWQSISNASTLKTTGQAYLDEHAAELKTSVTLSAADLHNLDVNVSAFRWMQRVTVKSVPHGVNTQYTITRVDIPLGEPRHLSLQLGDPQDVMTDRLVQNSVSKRGRGRGGTRGGGGRAASEDTMKEYGTEITRTDYEISLRAYQRDMDTVDSILQQAGLSLNSQGVLVYADDNANMWQSRLNVQANRIGLVVQGSGSNAYIKAAEIVASINNTGSSVTISADKIYLNGSTTIDNLLTGRSSMAKIWATNADIGNLDILPGGTLDVGNTELRMEQKSVSWQSQSVVTGVSITDASVNLSASHYFLYASSAESQTPSGSQSGYVVRSRTNGSHDVSKKTIYYLGRSSA